MISVFEASVLEKRRLNESSADILLHGINNLYAVEQKSLHSLIFVTFLLNVGLRSVSFRTERIYLGRHIQNARREIFSSVRYRTKINEHLHVKSEKNLRELEFL